MSKWQKKEIKKTTKQTNKNQGIKRKNKIIEKDKQKKYENRKKNKTKKIKTRKNIE